jgi:excisionase family DNA binding protein
MKYLTPTELAKKYGVSRMTIHRWLKDGKMPFDTLANGQKIIAEIDIPTFIRERKKI